MATKKTPSKAAPKKTLSKAAPKKTVPETKKPPVRTSVDLVRGTSGTGARIFKKTR